MATSVGFTTHKAHTTALDLPEGWSITRMVKEYGDSYFTTLWDPQMWNRQTGVITRFEGHRGEVLTLKCKKEFTTNKDVLFSGSRDNTVKMWDIKTGQCLVTFAGHEAPVLTIKYFGERLLISPTRLQITNKRLYTGSQDGMVKIWDPLSGACQKTFKGHQGAVLAIQVYANRLFSGSFDRTVKMWDIDSEKCLKTYRTSSEISALEVTDKHVIAGTFGGHIYVFDKESGACTTTLFGRLTSYFPHKLTEISALKAVGENLFAADSSGKVICFNLEHYKTSLIYKDGPENMCAQLKWKEKLNRLEIRIGSHYGAVDFQK